MGGINRTDFGDRATPRPGEFESIDCGVCGEKMDVERGVHGPTGMAEAMAGRGHEHDSFRCPHIDEGWHIQAKRLREEARRTPSGRLEAMLLEEAAEIAATRRATKEAR